MTVCAKFQNLNFHQNRNDISSKLKMCYCLSEVSHLMLFSIYLTICLNIFLFPCLSLREKLFLAIQTFDENIAGGKTV
jgi:hypothetical protein